MTVRTMCIALLAGLACQPVNAEFEGSWFQIEVLIFEHTGSRPENPEQWPTYPSLERRSPAVVIAEPDSQTDTVESANLDQAPIPFTPLSEPEWTLATEKSALEESRSYRVLYHQSWVQPVPGRNNATSIRIDAGDTYGSQHELQGYLELYVERYLHLNTDLQLVRYTQTDNPFRLIDDNDNALAGNASAPFMGLSLDQEANAISSSAFNSDIITTKNNQYYVATESIGMKQRRRMRSTELHYIDNPELGLLIYIVPIEIGSPTDSGTPD
ncbi:CsiV family protein [Saccharospirillum impatiens]|uniref:CsiV family protein n=1 Tax=Saccharospirillum impatiens TaxID=169438 RepID=UPI00146A8B57|nr:CsiV family protein [Saccharospirillum impatiens]